MLHRPTFHSLCLNLLNYLQRREVSVIVAESFKLCEQLHHLRYIVITTGKNILASKNAKQLTGKAGFQKMNIYNIFRTCQFGHEPLSIMMKFSTGRYIWAKVPSTVIMSYMYEHLALHTYYILTIEQWPYISYSFNTQEGTI